MVINDLLVEQIVSSDQSSDWSIHRRYRNRKIIIATSSLPPIAINYMYLYSTYLW